jgi:hypothetical protein
VGRRALPAFAAIDFLSCLLVVFVAVALTSQPPQVKTYGSYALVMTWPVGYNDVDLYVRDPRGAVCYFQNMQVDEMQLEHDDLGTAGTSYGKGKLNEERTVIRGTTPGQYVVDNHLYDRGEGTAPIPVTTQLWDLQGDDRLLKTRVVYVTHTGDERTSFRFTLDDAGNVTGYSSVPVSLVSRTTKAGSGNQ